MAAAIARGILQILLYLVPITLLAFPIGGAIAGGIQALPNIINIFGTLFQIIPFIIILPLFTTIFSIIIPQIFSTIEKVRKRRE